MRQLVYVMFITNNRASFHLWGKENLVKHQKVSKCYENRCMLLEMISYPLFISLKTSAK